MATFRMQDHSPDVYVRKSRDFQLFCNIFDCLNGAVKYDIDSIMDIIDTNQCNERLISLLQTKLGFWTDVKIPTSHLRIILKAFPYMVRNKGSIKGVKQAVQVFLKIRKIRTNVHIEVKNEDPNYPYTVIIGTQERLTHTEILEAILKYILPAGYAIKYVFYADTAFETSLHYADSVQVLYANTGILSSIRGVDENVPPILNNVNMTTISPVSYKGNPEVINMMRDKDGKTGIITSNGEFEEHNIEDFITDIVLEKERKIDDEWPVQNPETNHE